MRIIFFIVLGLFFLTDSIANSLSCSPIEPKTQNKNIILPGSNQARVSQLYFLHNISKKSLWIDHPLEGKQSAKAGWSSFLQTGNWSAILISKKDFAINCAVIEPGKVNYQECAKSIKVCIPKDIKLSAKRKGTYWLAEDKNYEELLAALEKRGIEIPKAAAQTQIPAKPKNEPVKKQKKE